MFIEFFLHVFLLYKAKLIHRDDVLNPTAAAFTPVLAPITRLHLQGPESQLCLETRSKSFLKKSYR